MQNQQKGALAPFEYKHPCEPYAVALSEAMPLYDERFRGRGMNKVEQLTHMAMWDFKWSVVPEEFVLHLPHEQEATGDVPGGWDRLVTPLVLMRLKMQEVEREKNFGRHIQQDIPMAV